MAKETIFLTGATGKIGRMLLKDLAVHDYNFIVLALKGEKVDMDGPHVKYIFGDITDPSSYAQALEGVDTVLHMAAITHTNKISMYYDINASATNELVNNCKKAGVKRFIFVSTRAISEKGGHYSVSKLMAEEYVRGSGLEWVILRLAEVYGIGGETGVNMIINKMDTMPFIPVIGDGSYKMAPVHISDVISSIETVIKESRINGRIYNIAGPKSYSFNDLVDTVAGIKNVRKAKIHIPIWMMRMSAYILSFFPGSGFFVMDQLPRFFSDKSDDISLAVKELNFKPVPLEEELKKQDNKTDFDDFGSKYKELLNREIGFLGDDMDYFAEYKARCVSKYLGDGFRGKIIDYGCGIGLIAKYLYKHLDKEKIEIMGYDISKELLKEADKNARGVKFFNDIRDISKGDFDVIIMANVMHHIKKEERRSFLKNVSGILKKGGYIFVFEHNPINPVTQSIVRRSVFDKDANLLPMSEVKQIFDGIGVKGIYKRYIVFFPRVLSFLRFLEPVLGFIPAGAQYFYVGKKEA